MDTSTGYLRVGDTVRLKGHGPVGGFNGQDLVVTGFKPMVVGRITHGYRALKTPLQPGIYLDTNHVGVATKTGISCDYHYWHGALQLADPNETERRGPRPQQPPPVFIRDLPETTFWEGDVVAYNFIVPEGEPHIVTAVDYFNCTANGDHLPDHVPVYRLGALSDGLAPGFIGEAPRLDLLPPNRLKLIKRGNVWRHHHGEPLSFDNVVEEARFAILMGWFTALERKESLQDTKLMMEAGMGQAYFTVRHEHNPLWEAVLVDFNDARLGAEYRELLNDGEEPINIR